jgi:hypothetical protein
MTVVSGRSERPLTRIYGKRGSKFFKKCRKSKGWAKHSTATTSVTRAPHYSWICCLFNRDLLFCSLDQAFFDCRPLVVGLIAECGKFSARNKVRDSENRCALSEFAAETPNALTRSLPSSLTLAPRVFAIYVARLPSAPFAGRLSGQPASSALKSLPVCA